MDKEYAERCGNLAESDLQRFCGDLYYSHALESFAGVLMFLFFGYVWLRLQVRGNLKSPAKAFWRMTKHHSYLFLKEFFSTLSLISTMGKHDLETRMRFCGNCDKMTCVVSCFLSLLGVTRWMSMGNVNGLRYLGYFLTCPLMQVELVILIAPHVPFYQLSAAFTGGLCFVMLSVGYGSSLLATPIYAGSMVTYIQTGNWDDLQPYGKLDVVLPGLAGISFLSFIQMPFLAMCYTCAGGERNIDCPPGYLGLLFMVCVSWLAFPFWWFLSWEGNAVINDTKFNEIGFTILNLLSKGLYIRSGMIMSDRHKDRIREKKISEGENVPRVVSRKISQAVAQSLFVNVLRRYDEGGDMGDCDSDDDDAMYNPSPACNVYGYSTQFAPPMPQGVPPKMPAIAVYPPPTTAAPPAVYSMNAMPIQRPDGIPKQRVSSPQQAARDDVLAKPRCREAGPVPPLLLGAPTSDASYNYAPPPRNAPF